jgi:hypothetical protein
VQAGDQGEALRRVTDRLHAEFVDSDATQLPGIRSTVGEEGGMNRVLGAEDEALVAQLRETLAGIASTLSKGTREPAVRAIKTALDGAEFVIRSELLSGNADRVVRLLPSFVFLVALPVADHDRAIELSLRTAELTEGIG